MSLHSSLVKKINFAIETLDSFKIEKGLKDDSAIVLSSLFRKIIELSDGVRVSAENGLKAPAGLSYRSLLEAHLTFKYITIDSDHINDRVKAYKINNHKLQIQAIKEAASNDMADENEERFEKILKIHLDEMGKEKYEEVLAEYDRMHYHDRNNRRKFVPKWHALYGGPQSVNQLAEIMGERMGHGDQVGKRMQQLYGYLSQDAHNYLALRDTTRFENGNIELNSIRDTSRINTSNHYEDDFNLMPVQFLLDDAIKTFISIIYPEYEERSNSSST